MSRSGRSFEAGASCSFDPTRQYIATLYGVFRVSFGNGMVRMFIISLLIRNIKLSSSKNAVFVENEEPSGKTNAVCIRFSRNYFLCMEVRFIF